MSLRPERKSRFLPAPIAARLKAMSAILVRLRDSKPPAPAPINLTVQVNVPDSSPKLTPYPS